MQLSFLIVMYLLNMTTTQNKIIKTLPKMKTEKKITKSNY